MIQRLGNNLQVRIPYKTIFKSQRSLLHRLYDSVSTEHNYIGEAKLSSRMTFILLAFLFALVEQPDKNKIYYICQSKARSKQVKQMAIRLRQFYKKNQFPQTFTQRSSIESFEKNFNLQRSEIVILQSFFHKEMNLLKDYPNDKYISILSVKQYFAEVIQQKINFKGHTIHGVKANYMLLETVAYDQIIETCISGWINEVIIRRAFIEHKKLQVYYHQRDDKRRLLQKNQQKNQANQTLKFAENGLKRRTSNSSIDNQSNHSHSRQKQSNIFHGHHKNIPQKMWSISEIQKRIYESYQNKKQKLVKQKNNKNPNQIEEEKTEVHQMPSFEQQALISLQVVGLLINFFQNYQVLTRQLHKTGKEEITTEQFSSQKMIEELQKKTLIKHQKLRKVYDTVKRLIQVYPPVVNRQEYAETNILFRKGRKKNAYTLSTKHILHLAKFCKDLIEFHEIFNQKYSECIQVSKSCYKERDKPSFFQVKFKCLNQPLLTEIILEFNEYFIVLMNNGISLQFYSAVFKPKVLMKAQSEAFSIIEEQAVQSNKSFKFKFDQPTDAVKYIFNNIYGLNVTITPSEQNLRIPELTSKDDAEHDSLIIKAYGVLLFDLCEIISDGIVVYFPNASIINRFKKQWMEKEDIYTKINQIKRIFEETDLEQKNIQNLEEYKKVCDIGRGGIYFLAANGGMAKYTQLYGHYSRCVVFVGIPRTYEGRKKQSLTEREKQEKKKKQLYFNLKQNELETFYGLKTTAKCLSNCINCNIEPKSVLFADVAYNKQSSKKWFPFIQEGSLNTSEAIQKMKKFNQFSQKRYEQGLSWQMGKFIRKNSIGKNESLNKLK